MKKRHKNDLYETDRKLTAVLTSHIGLSGRVLECCAGRGAMAAALPNPHVSRLITNDIDAALNPELNYNAASKALYDLTKPDWTVTNPPFSEAEDILPAAYAGSRVGVAFLLRLSYLEPIASRGNRTGRADWLRQHQNEMSHLIVVNPRPRFRLDTRNTDSVTVAWMVWQHGWGGGTAVRFVQGWDK